MQLRPDWLVPRVARVLLPDHQLPVSRRSEVTREKEPARTTQPARPTSAFKTRYLIGMGIYLLGANFIGVFVTSFFQSNHLDSILTTFNLFGSAIVVRTSTLAYLAMLVILLVLLARFDLIPRNFSAMTGQSSQSSRRGGSSNTNRNSSEMQEMHLLL